MTKKRDDSQTNETLSARQDTLAACLAAGSTVAAACRRCHVSKATAWRWLQVPAFTARIQSLRKDLLDAAVGKLASMMAGAATDKLRELLEADSASLRLDVVEKIFDLYLRTTSNIDLKAELEQIKASLPQGK
jgi:hypothetical protein